MLMNVPNPETHPVVEGVTLTIPGPALPVKRAQAIFHRFSQSAQEAGFCFVWRVEIQKRGALHWHLITGGSGGEDGEEFGKFKLSVKWWNALEDEGPFRFDPPVLCGKDMLISEVSSLMAWPGACLHSVDVKKKGDSGAWMRYMQDHTSKAKQEQIAVGIGRQWGIVGRKHFIKCVPETVAKLTDIERDRFLRVLQRMATPRVVDARCPFGYRHGKRYQRGRVGKSVWFEEAARLSAVRRMIEWAKRSTEVSLKSERFDNVKGLQ